MYQRPVARPGPTDREYGDAVTECGELEPVPGRGHIVNRRPLPRRGVLEQSTWRAGGGEHAQHTDERGKSDRQAFYKGVAHPVDG